MPESGGGPPQYLADQLTLFQPGEGILSPPINTASPLQLFSPSGITAYRHFENFRSQFHIAWASIYKIEYYAQLDLR